MVKRKTVMKMIAWTIALVVILLVITILFVDPWIRKKIHAALNEGNGKYLVEIKSAHVPVFRFGLELETIVIHTKPEYLSDGELYLEIASVKIKGINLTKVLFKGDYSVREVTISGLRGVVPVSEDSIQPLISAMNLRFEKIGVDGINLKIVNKASTASYSVKDGFLKVYDFELLERDTISTAMAENFDLKAQEFLTVSGDSMYTIAAIGISYTSDSRSLQVDSFSILPNFKDYDFTSRHEFQTDRIEASFNSILARDFAAAGYLKSGSLLCSYVEIGKMNMRVFRDRRKKFLHVKKPMFQEMIYNYPGIINIDSIRLSNGHVTYIEHARHANHPGRISFDEINAEINTITNDTGFKAQKAFLEIKSNALLMGEGKLSISLKSELFDSRNTFSLTGSLSGMEAKSLNPMLERNAFLYAASGKIDEMNFFLTANNNSATGRMTMRYHGLDIAIKNQETDDTTAIREIVVSIIANIKVMDSNPLPGKELRVGIIANERDPEKFIFNYCFKSILSGIKSSIAKNPSGK